MLISHGGSIWRRSQAETMVRCIIHGIETLKEGIAVEKVKALPTGSSDIPDDEVDIISIPSNNTIQRTGPNLRIRSQLVRHLKLYIVSHDSAGPIWDTYLIDVKEETLQIRILRASDL